MTLSFGLNKSLFYLFLFTLISSFLAYQLVVKAYSGIYDDYSYESTVASSR
jgi:hypothetical protein